MFYWIGMVEGRRNRGCLLMLELRSEVQLGWAVGRLEAVAAISGSGILDAGEMNGTEN